MNSNIPSMYDILNLPYPMNYLPIKQQIIIASAFKVLHESHSPSDATITKVDQTK